MPVTPRIRDTDCPWRRPRGRRTRQTRANFEQDVTHAILIEELGDRPVRLAEAGDALAAAVELLDHQPRDRWPAPRGGWEELVVALAVATRRTEGSLGVGRAAALLMVGRVLEIADGATAPATTDPG